MRAGMSFANPGAMRTRRTLLALVVLLGAGNMAGAAHAEVAQRAVITAGPRGDASVQIGRRVLWRSQSAGTRVVSDVVWSRAGDAVAFATRERAGRTRLVVVMVGGDAHGETVSWPVPARAITVRRPVIVWLDARRVTLGASELQPALVASWSVASSYR
jgi:hypothetical protein